MTNRPPLGCASTRCAAVLVALGRSLVVVTSVASASAFAQSPSGGGASSVPPPIEFADAIRRHSECPRVGEVVAAALREANVHPERVLGALRRGRRAGLLPNVRLGVSRDHGLDLSARDGTTNDLTSLRRGDDLRVEATVTFSLDRLTYGPDEVAWSRESRALEAHRAEVVRDVVALYYRRLRILVERELVDEPSLDHDIDLAETEALLEVFTGGAFSRIIAERTRPHDARATTPPARVRANRERDLDR